MTRYTHSIATHNLKAPLEIVPLITGLVKPKSVIDIGCGLGDFLKVFKDHGIENILGLDGPWCNKQLLFRNIDSKYFIEFDLENRISLDRRFDLAISLEVAEHLTPGRAASFVEDLTNLSDTIVFAAAVPGQGGDHHLNEQWPSYWSNLFSQYNYKCYDILKPLFWGSPDIFYWYKQNMVFYIKIGSENEKIITMSNNVLSNVIHPELFLAFSDYRQKNSIKRHIKLLLKAIFYKIKLLN